MSEVRNGVIRAARREDCVEIRRLIQELADFEKMPTGPKIGANILERDGFDREVPLFHCFVVQGEASQLLGYALYFSYYSTWEGETVYLEDLYVTPQCRKQGYGKALIAAVAKVATDKQCTRLDFSVLDWNPAQQFYKACGAQNMTEKEGWLRYRIADAALTSLAQCSSIT